MLSILCIIAILAVLCTQSAAFQARSARMVSARGTLSMEYIPDGLTKQQWAALKKKEEEEMKKKGNLGALGTTRFKSRSFEAWQKSGGKHLFPVDPRTTPYEERPYMQRRNGDWEGKDLSSKGYKGKGQGVAGFRLKIDGVYEKAKAEGKLDSASILGGVPLPWTKKDTEKVGAQSSENVQGARAQTGRRLSDAELARRKAKLVKPTFKKTTKGTKSAEPVAAAPEKKKGLFGMF